MSIQNVGAVARIIQPASVEKPTSSKSAQETPFAQVLRQGVSSANQALKTADTSVQTMVETQGANIHETMIALDKAEIATRLTAKIGQKLVQAYREINQIQV